MWLHIEITGLCLGYLELYNTIQNILFLVVLWIGWTVGQFSMLPITGYDYLGCIELRFQAGSETTW